MITIAICEDQEEIREKLIRQLKKVATILEQEVKIVAFASGEQLLSFYTTHALTVDAIFLDICLGEMNGIEIGKQLRHRNPLVPIIFLTSSKAYAIDSYQVSALDYVIKPAKIAQLEQIMLKIQTLKIQHQQQKLLVKTKQQLYCLNLHEVVYFESSLRTITAHLANQTTVTFYQKMSNLETELPKSHFLRIHRSYCVNVLYVKNLLETDVTTVYEQLLPMSKKYATEVKQQFSAYIKSQMQGE